MRNSKDVLIVAQNQLANQIEDILKCAEYKCTITTDISKAVDLLEDNYRLVVLDLEFPETFCRMFLRTIYSYYSKTRVLTFCKDAETMLKMDLPKFYFQDFIVEPIHPDELICRIRFQLYEYTLERTLAYGNTILDLGASKMITNRRSVDLSRYEHELAKILFENRNNLVTREMILNRISYLGEGGNLRSVDIRICVLRKKLSIIHSNLSIVTKRKLGYYLTSNDDL